MLEIDVLVIIDNNTYQYKYSLITGWSVITGVVSHKYLMGKLTPGPKHPPPNNIGMPVGPAGILPPFILPSDPRPSPSC